MKGTRMLIRKDTNLDMARPFLVPKRYTLILITFSLDEVLIL